MGFAFIVREVATTDHAFMCCSLVVVGGVVVVVVVVVGFAFIASYLKLLLLFSIVVRFTTHSPTQSSISLPTGCKKQNRISFTSVCIVKFNEVVRQEQALNGAVPLISLRSFMRCTNFFFSYAACSGDFHETQAAAAAAH
jgi:hypothetical protein